MESILSVASLRRQFFLKANINSIPGPLLLGGVTIHFLRGVLGRLRPLWDLRFYAEKLSKKDCCHNFFLTRKDFCHK